MYINNPKGQNLIKEIIPQNQRSHFIFKQQQNPNNTLTKAFLDIVFILSENTFRNFLISSLNSLYQEIEKEVQSNSTQLNKQEISQNIEKQFTYYLVNLEIIIIEQNENNCLQYQLKCQLPKQTIIQNYKITNNFLSFFQITQNNNNIDQISQEMYNQLLQNKIIQLHQSKVQNIQLCSQNNSVNQIKNRQIINVINNKNTLILQQNGDLIICQTNNQQNIFLSKGILFFQCQKLFQLQNNFFKNNVYQIAQFSQLDQNCNCNGFTIIKYFDQILFQGFIYQGLLNGKGQIYQNNTLIFEGQFVNNHKHGIGIIINNNQQWMGNFNNNKLQGELQLINSSYNNQYFQSNNQSISTQQNRYQLNVAHNQKGDYIQFQAYISLDPGKWLFENSLDYFISFFLKQFNVISNINKKQIIFNTCQSMDFFQTENSICNINIFEWNKYCQENQIDFTYRKLFVINYSKCHFLIYIEDDGKLYVCDSLYAKKQEIEQKICQLLGLQCQSAIQIKCQQQRNGYDCGVYAIFNVLQFIKYSNLSIKEIETKLYINHISKFRWQLKQLITQNPNYVFI